MPRTGQAERSAPTADRLIRTQVVAERLGICRRQVEKLRATGRLPEPLKIGRSTRYRESDIALYIAVGCDMRAFQAAREGGQR